MKVKTTKPPQIKLINAKKDLPELYALYCELEERFKMGGDPWCDGFGSDFDDGGFKSMLWLENENLNKPKDLVKVCNEVLSCGGQILSFKRKEEFSFIGTPSACKKVLDDVKRRLDLKAFE